MNGRPGRSPVALTVVATGAATGVRGGRRAAGPDGGRGGLPNRILSSRFKRGVDR